MKKDIHPTYHQKAKITCACGAVFEVGSTQEKTKVELCSQCHPFYTGKERLVDTQGRLDRFKKKMAKAEEMKKARQGTKSKEEKVAAQQEKQQEKLEKETIDIKDDKK